MTWTDNICTYCLHGEGDHDFGPDRRIPKAVESGKYVCSDCATCELEGVKRNA